MKIFIQKQNNKLLIKADTIDTLNFIDRNFSFFVNENYKWIPAVKEHRWDGKIHFLKDSYMRLGLLSELVKFCKLKNIQCKVDFKIKNVISEDKIKEWINSLKIPFEVRDYQFKIFYDLLVYKNITALSETGSGKSLIIYLVIRFMIKNNLKSMLIVPNIDLLYQMKKDFISYGWNDCEEYLQIIGDSHIVKEFKKPIIISTWQSLNSKRMKLYDRILRARKSELLSELKNLSELEYNNKKVIIDHTLSRLKNIISDHIKKFKINSIKNMFKNTKDLFPNYKEINLLIDEFELHIKKEFNSIDCVIGDECDTSTGDALNHLLDMFKESKFRIGLTGSMPVKEYSDWYTIVSNFGRFTEYNTYRGLADRGDLSDVEIELNFLNYNDEDKKKYHELVVSSSYTNALYYTSKIEKRNDWILELINSIKNENTLLLFQFKEGEGHNYYKHFKDKTDKKLVYIDGDIKDRTNIQSWMKNTNEKYICLGSLNTMSRGINIPNLQHIILLSSFRNRENLFQAVGRLTRLYGNNKVIFHDLIDNFVITDDFGRVITNISVNHYFDRIEYYKEKKYKIEEKTIDLK